MGQIIQIRPAQASEAKPLIGFYDLSGKGKTLTALLVARGFVGPTGKIIMIETESGRGEAYQDHPEVRGYDVISLRGSFSPREYGEALTVAEEAATKHNGTVALIIDSASHEWEGAGGVLDMAAVNQANNVKGLLVWQKPKMEHAKYFMLRLLQTPIDLVIVNMRAKYPMEGTGANIKRSTQLVPKQSEDILYELFVHGHFDDQHRFHGTKYTLESWKAALPSGQVLGVKNGEMLRKVASGQATAPAPEPEQVATSDFDSLFTSAKLEALGGADSMRAWWVKLPKEDQKTLQPHLAELRSIADRADTSDDPPADDGDDVPFDDPVPDFDDWQPEDDPPATSATQPRGADYKSLSAPQPTAPAKYALKTSKGVVLAEFAPEGFLKALTSAIEGASAKKDRAELYNQNAGALGAIAMDRADLKPDAEGIAKRWALG